MSFDTTQEFEMVPVGEVHEHPQNPRKGNVDVIDESMDTVGFYGACTVHKATGDIIAGNHRYRVAVAKGATQIPVVWFHGTDEEALRVLLVDNKSSDGGEYDRDRLDSVLASLPTLTGTGYGLDALAAEMESDEPEPAIPVGTAIPDDMYEPLWAIQVPCESEAAQEALFRWLSETRPDLTLRVLAL